MKNLLFPSPVPGPVRLLIGSENADLMSAQQKDIEVSPNHPVARLTRLGMTASGPTPYNSDIQANLTLHTVLLSTSLKVIHSALQQKPSPDAYTSEDFDLDELSRRLWLDTDIPPTPTPYTKSEKQAVDIIEKTRNLGT